MRKLFLLSVTAFALSMNGAFAADTPPPSTADKEAAAAPREGFNENGMTLAEARKRAHTHADKLDKMSEAEWAEHEKKHQEFMAKWNKLTPQEKEEFRQAQKAKRKEWRAKQDATKQDAVKPVDSK